MELTLDQALQKGVESHRAGKVQEADRYYTAILKANPKHPDANHNMGVLAVGVGKVTEALPFFKTALEANSNIAQYWLSYIDALIKLDRITDAKKVFDQAKSKGAKGDGFDELDERIKEAGQEPLKANQIASEAQPNILDSLKLDQAISLAKKKEKAGSPEESKRIYEDILVKFPKNKRAIDGLTGLTSNPVGTVSKAQNPPQDQLQSLIDLYSQGLHQQAIKQAETLVQQFPKSAVLFNIQGAIFKGLSQLDLSVAALNKALSIKPDYAEAHNNMGNTLQEQGKFEEAIQAYIKAIAIKPDYADAYNNMGNTLQEQGKFEEAIKAYTKALSIKPDYAQAHNNMGVALQEQDKLEEAIEACNKALTIKPDFAEAYNNMGNALREQSKLDEAIEALNKALAIKPDFAEAYNNMGVALQDQGKLDEAIQGYNKALAIKPDYAEAHRYISLIKKYTADNKQFLQVKELYGKVDLKNDARCNLSFALAKMYEDIGELDRAFQHLSEGNALRKKLLNYSIEKDKKLFSYLKKVQPKVLKNSLKVREASTDITPVFILGMPRSGTTLVEQIISAHSEVIGAGELKHVSQLGLNLSVDPKAIDTAAISKFREKYLSELSKLSDSKQFITDKMPQNFRFIPLICAALPEAKIIHVQRNAAATCWSNYKHYFTTKYLGYCYDLNDVVKYYNLYKDLMQHWQSEYSDRLYNLNYENLTTDQENQTRKLIKYLELTWENACLSPHKNKRSVRTASRQQVRNKVYKGSSEAWKKYELYLNRVFDNLPYS